ncbi:F-box protein At2g27310 [Lactuca sativa]|uniref:F-box protein At2g27310 n=1 Tax=Lactuca sativa TaxID=4236 RepID=UPI000CD92B43|nr:F-box protein At2g27310 [Lactuca sativa]
MAIADIHEDIIKTHILTRLDGQTLAAAGCASSQLQSLCSDQKLWSDICSYNWPSTVDPLVIQAISNFPSGYRSFYSDSSSSPTYRLSTTTSLPATSHIISSVDLRYHDELIFSTVESTNTTPSDWFQSSPFRIDLLQLKELIPSSIKFSGDNQVLLSNLEKNMTLSWIMIDPSQNRAVNLSSIKPVSVRRNWLTGNIEVIFAVVIAPDVPLHGNDYVNCNIQITCGVKEGGGELNMSGASLMVLDMDGKCLSGKESMVILQGLAVAQRRRRRYSGGGEEQKERYGEFIQRRRERKEKMERRERRLDMACVASGVGILMAFWSFALSW